MKELKSFDEHLDKYRGKKGTDKYDADSLAFRLGVMHCYQVWLVTRK
jgi:hypothetical protein